MQSWINLRLDKLIYLLLTKSANDLFQRTRKVALNPYTKDKTEIRKRHQASMVILNKDIKGPMTGRKWVVNRNPNKTYTVELLWDCAIQDCLRCRVCNVCRHMVRCSCLPSSKRKEICTHIHAVCTHRQDAVRHRFPIHQRNPEADLLKLNRFVVSERREDLDIKRIQMMMLVKNARHLGPQEEARIYETLDSAYKSPSARFMEGTRSPANKMKTPQRQNRTGRRLF